MDATAPILLDRNENRYGPAPACLDVLRNADPELHGLDEQQIIIGYGCEDLLKQAVHHFLAPGRTILIPQASWWYYRAVADEVRGVTVAFPMTTTATRYEYDIESLLRLRETVDPALVLLASPNNATGNAIDRDDLLRVLDYFQDVPLVLDQAHFGFAPHEVDDFAALTRAYPNLLILRTFSKLYALAGVRIGYAILGDGLPGFRRFCARNLGYNRFSEKLAMTALDCPADYEDVGRRLRSLPGSEIYDSEASFVLVKLPEAVVPGLKQELLDQGLVIKFLTEPAFIDHASIGEAG